MTKILPSFLLYPAFSNAKCMRFRRIAPTFQVKGTRERERERERKRERERERERETDREREMERDVESFAWHSHTTMSLHFLQQNKLQGDEMLPGDAIPHCYCRVRSRFTTCGAYSSWLT